MPVFSDEQIREKQKRKWGMEVQEVIKKKKPAEAPTVKKPNKYINIILRDIDYLWWRITGGYIRWKKNREIHKDFMEQHFGGLDK